MNLTFDLQLFADEEFLKDIYKKDRIFEEIDYNIYY